MVGWVDTGLLCPAAKGLNVSFFFIVDVFNILPGSEMSGVPIWNRQNVVSCQVGETSW